MDTVGVTRIGEPETTGELLLRPEEVAKRLSVSRGMAYKLIADGALPSLKVGRCRRVDAADLRAWIAEQRQAA